MIRSALIISVKLFGSLPLVASGLELIDIPDFVGVDAFIQLSLVIKSVSAAARLPLFLAVAPDARFIYMLRNPCAKSLLYCVG